MKHLLTLGLLLLLTIKSFAQTDGITYQAVIIGPDVLELPGVDSEGNILPVTTVAIKFTIFDSGNQVEFQEIQITDTDEFGRINLIIGAVEHDDFEKISWDGTSKDLKVEIDFEGGSSFVDMSREQLTFVPYAYHRNITATGTLDVDGDSFLNRELTVNGPTNLNSTLSVNDGNETNLTGDLIVGGETNLDRSLTVGVGTSGIDEEAPTLLNGTLDVIGKTTVDEFEAKGKASFNDLEAETLLVNIKTDLKGEFNVNSDSQIVLESTVHTDGILYIDDADGVLQVLTDPDPGTVIDNYPVLVHGSTQGIAIKVTEKRHNGNNFVSFWDTDGMCGRIEGETPSEFENNADYLFDQRALKYDIFDAGFDLATGLYELAKSFTNVGMAATSSAPCVGFGACVTSPIPSWIVGSTAQSVAAGIQAIAAGVGVGIAANNLVQYNKNKKDFQGVSYASGAGDYAEYLQREHINEKMTYGDIVGVKGGKISKNLIGADRMMVISYQPIVLGNMPQPNREAEYEKVAFMGQVPVKVFGKVNVGDYIVPSGKNDGIGIGIAPSSITTKRMKEIVGVAWTNSDNTFGFNLVTVAVGLNKNDGAIIIEKLQDKVQHQATEISDLKSQIENILTRISDLEGGSNSSKTKSNNENHEEESDKIYKNRKYNIVESEENDIIYFELTKDDFDEAFILAEQMIRDSGQYERNKEVIEKLKSDSAYNAEFFGKLKKQLDKQIHYHKNIDKKGKH